MIDSIQSVVDNHLCLSCGACVAVSPPGTIELVYREDRGMSVPEVSNPRVVSGRDLAFDVCPGKGIPLLELAGRRTGRDTNYAIELGHWTGMWALHARNRHILGKASSGGAMTALSRFLLESGRVQGVVVTRMKYGKPGPRTETFIATSLADLVSAQGSKYCPVPALEILQEAERFKGALAFVGTPCQIAALRMIQDRRPEMKQKFPYVIGNFCGGIRDFRETDTLLRRYGLDPSRVVRFRYRGGGQPGTLYARDADGNSTTRAYPAYARDTGFTKLPRCLLCIDATAELADFSCGDAWLDRFLHSDHPWSILLARTAAAKEIIETMGSRGLLKLANITSDEVIRSQRENLTSKKVRQNARRRLYKLIGRALPTVDGGYPEVRGSLPFEAFVTLGHSISEGAEMGSVPCRFSLKVGRFAKSGARTIRNRLKKQVPPGRKKNTAAGIPLTRQGIAAVGDSKE